MNITQFKKAMKDQVGKIYACTAYGLTDGKVKFNLPPRKLGKVSTVNLAFVSHKNENHLSYIDFPNAANFGGDCNEFTFTNEGFNSLMRYTLVEYKDMINIKWMITVRFPNGTIKFYSGYDAAQKVCIFTDNKDEADKALTKDEMWYHARHLKDHFSNVERIAAVVHHDDEVARF